MISSTYKVHYAVSTGIKNLMFCKPSGLISPKSWCSPIIYDPSGPCVWPAEKIGWGSSSKKIFWKKFAQGLIQLLTDYHEETMSLKTLTSAISGAASGTLLSHIMSSSAEVNHIRVGPLSRLEYPEPQTVENRPLFEKPDTFPEENIEYLTKRKPANR